MEGVWCYMLQTYCPICRCHASQWWPYQGSVALPWHCTEKVRDKPEQWWSGRAAVYNAGNTGCTSQWCRAVASFSNMDRDATTWHLVVWLLALSWPPHSALFCPSNPPLPYMTLHSASLCVAEMSIYFPTSKRVTEKKIENSNVLISSLWITFDQFLLQLPCGYVGMSIQFHLFWVHFTKLLWLHLLSSFLSFFF